MPRWAAHPFAAILVRIAVAVVPIAASLLFVLVVSRLVPAPSESLVGYLAWWLGLCTASTAVLVGIDKLARRCLPLGTLLGLSLVFPDQAPSRFKIALRTGTVRQLREVVEGARVGKVGETPAEAAERVLELVAALNAHDRITRGHSERVRAYTKMIGEELGLDPREVDLLHWAGLLHDIGKLEVPYEILNKTSRPTDEEWEILKRHPEVGARMVAPLAEWLGAWVLAVGQHHERWDGTGYPSGLAGIDISLAARIVSVADVFDVITSARSYKEPIDAQAARAEISRCAGAHFDPEVVRAFLSISLGRLRLAMGPLSLLAQSPLGGVSIPPIIGAAVSGLAISVASLVGGIFTGPQPASASGTAALRAVAAAPVAPTVRAEIDEDTAATVALTGLRTDHLRQLRVLSASGGTAVPAAGGAVVVTPPSGFIGGLRFGYEACWPNGCAEGMLIVTVRPVDHTPIAAADEVTIDQGGTASIPVLANDSDPEHDALMLSSVSRPRVGRAEIVGDLVRYTPPSTFAGTTQFSYRVADPSGARADASITVYVRPVDQAPVAAPDVVTVTESQTTVLDPLANDSDPDGDVLTMTSVGAPAVGRVRSVGDLIVYTPPPGYSGPDSVGYTVRDPSGASASAVISITVVPVNDPPTFTAGPDQTVAEDAGAQVVAGWATGISAGPADEQGQTVSFTVTGDNPSLFSVAPAVAADGTLTYTPAPNVHGSASFTVTATDDGGGAVRSARQIFTITVVSVNDAPGFTAGADQSVLEDGGAQSVAGWATGIGAGPVNESGQVVSFSVSNDNAGLFAVAPVVAGDGTLSYTAAANAFGSATVTVRAVDDGGTANGGVDTSAPQTFTITVVPVPPSPQPDAYTVNQDTTLSMPAPGVLGNDFDNLGNPVTAQPPAVAGPTNGVLTLNADGSFVYTPSPGFIGTDTFTYRVDDGHGLTATADVTITVNSGVTAGTFYLGTSGSSASNYDLTTTPPAAASPVPDFDGDGSPGLTIKSGDGKESISDPSKYHLWTYPTPTPLALDGPVALDLWSSVKAFALNQDVQADVFLYDCAAGGTGCVTIGQAQRHIQNWNLLPSWTEHNIVLGSVTRTIASGRELRVRLLVEHEDVWVAMTAAYPSALNVTLANAAPVANPDSATVLEDSPTTNLAVLANDTDANLAPSSVTIVTPPTKGTATPKPDGTIDYTPGADLNGADSFVYRVCDTAGLCANATVSITITSVNDAPQFVKGSDQATLEDAGPQSVPGWATAMSPGPANESGQFLSFSVTSDNPSLFSSQPAVAANGALSFTTAADAFGSATVTVRLVDAGGTANGGVDTSAPQTFTITVLPVNDAPSFGLAGGSTSASGTAPVSIPGWATAISAGPANEAGQSVTFTVTNDNPGLFSVAPAIAPDGTLTFTPGGSAGTVVVTVTASDDGGVANGGADTSASQTFTVVLS